MLKQSFVCIEGVAADHLIRRASDGFHLLSADKSLCEWGCYGPLSKVGAGKQYAPQVSKRLLMGIFLS